jgi:hypothetical protein
MDQLGQILSDGSDGTDPVRWIGWDGSCRMDRMGRILTDGSDGTDSVRSSIRCSARWGPLARSLSLADVDGWIVWDGSDGFDPSQQDSDAAASTALQRYRYCC